MTIPTTDDATVYGGWKNTEAILVNLEAGLNKIVVSAFDDTNSLLIDRLVVENQAASLDCDKGAYCAANSEKYAEEAHVCYDMALFCEVPGKKAILDGPCFVLDIYCTANPDKKIDLDSACLDEALYCETFPAKTTELKAGSNEISNEEFVGFQNFCFDLALYCEANSELIMEKGSVCFNKSLYCDANPEDEYCQTNWVVVFVILGILFGIIGGFAYLIMSTS